ncbi:hypothetical protein [Azospirillum palustre]
MAKLSELIPTIAATLGMPETAVEAYAKVLRKAGLITTGGRGFGAADMSAKDCGNLLIAIMAGSPTYAVERVNTYGNLTCAGRLGELAIPIANSFHLPPGHSFSDLLCRMIELSSSDRIDHACLSALQQASIASNETPDILISSIEVGFPEPSAKFELSAFLKSKDFSDKIQIHYMADDYWGSHQDYYDKMPEYGDLKHQSLVSMKTIKSLGAAIRK